MFCAQCEQTAHTSTSYGCDHTTGVCGKTAEVSDLQDILVFLLEGLSFWADLARRYNIVNNEIDQWAPQALFATLTNVNFDPIRILQLAQQAQSYRDQLANLVEKSALAHALPLPPMTKAAYFQLPNNFPAIVNIAEQTAVNREQNQISADTLGLRLLCLYGLKGAAAYMEHARVLGQTDTAVYTQYHQIMGFLGSDCRNDQQLLNTAMQIGELNYQVMAMLDAGETASFGHPQPSRVNTNPIAGKCILVSGHDMCDLKTILEQTQDLGINVYTNGELLPAHAYPELKKFPHLVGNYGSAWQNQQREFAKFPGAIVMTSNCLIAPTVGQYADRLFTRNIVGWPGVQHLTGDDFSDVIECALAQSGFTDTQTEQQITIGFGHQSLMNAAPAVIEQVKSGNISHFFLIGGCDGAKTQRRYYTDFAQQVPDNAIILTLGCGKYRFNKENFGEISGIPRLLDVGQCNDAYSAIQLVLALADSFECGINELPLTLVLSWFEQKAIVILLTLLSLGVRGIYTGPTAPAFLTENLLNTLKEQFDLRLTSDAKSDLSKILTA